jgi:hypothetical protein
MIGLHRKGKVVVSVNRVGMACGEAGKRTGLNWAYSSTTTRFFIYHGENLVAGDLFLSRYWFSLGDIQFRAIGIFARY